MFIKTTFKDSKKQIYTYNKNEIKELEITN